MTGTVLQILAGSVFVGSTLWFSVAVKSVNQKRSLDADPDHTHLGRTALLIHLPLRGGGAGGVRMINVSRCFVITVLISKSAAFVDKEAS